MKKILTVIMIMLLSAISVSAQSYLPGKVAFTPVFGNYTGFSDEVCSIMEQRLTQIVVSNGLGSYSNQYVITARIFTEDKQATSTTPAQYVVNLTIQFTALDVENNILVGEISVPVKGVDRTENRAYINAIRQLSPSNQSIRTFIRKSTDNILQAYNRSARNLITQADNMAAKGDYEGALATLASIPTEIDDYAKVQACSEKIYAESVSKKQSEAAAVAQQKAESEEKAAEEAQREKDRQMQQAMAEALEKSNRESKRNATIEKVKGWFLGNIKFT